MILGKKIEIAIAESGLPIAKVAADAGISEATLRRMLKKDSANTGELNKLSAILKKPLSFFLNELEEKDRSSYKSYQKSIDNIDRNVNNNLLEEKANKEFTVTVTEYNIIFHELELCRREKASLEKEISLKDRIIELLENKQK